MTDLNDALRAILAKAKNNIDAATAVVLKDRALVGRTIAAYLGALAEPSQTDAGSRRRTGPKRRPHTPPQARTREQKTAAVLARQELQATIFDHRLRHGRRLGDVRMHELRAWAEEAARTAASFLTRGFEDAVEAEGLLLLSEHCVAADPHARVQDTIKPDVATGIFQRAKVIAVQKIAEASNRAAQYLIEREPAQVEGSP